MVTPSGTWSQKFKFGDSIQLPFLKIRVDLLPDQYRKGVWHFNFGNYWSIVKEYQQIIIQPNPEGSSILEMSLTGTNKYKLVDYINTSSVVLEKAELLRKNKFAISTIQYIDSVLAAEKDALQSAEQALKDFNNKSNFVDAGAQIQNLNDRLINFESRREALLNTQRYYTSLKTYLQRNTDYSNIQAPTLLGISENSVNQYVSQIVEKSNLRKSLEYGVKEGTLQFERLDRDIASLKKVILENIASSTGQLESELKLLNEDISEVEIRDQ